MGAGGILDGIASGDGPDTEPEPLARLLGRLKYPESVGSMTMLSGGEKRQPWRREWE